MAKSPAFQFYPGDWLSSEKIMLMTPAEEGAYIRLLAIAWGSEDCGLPDDDKQLAILSRLGEGWLKGGSRVVRQCFYSENGRLYNARLLKERKKQEAWRKKSSEGGKKSAKVRWGKGLSGGKGGYKKVITKQQPKGNSSSSSSSSSSKSVYKKSTTHFQDFWESLPPQMLNHRSEAERLYDESVRSQEDYEALKLALSRYLKTKRVAEGFYQNLDTWMRDWQGWLKYEDPVVDNEPPPDGWGD